MEKQRQDDQHEPTYSSSVPIRDVALQTCRKQWAIERGGEKGAEISVLIARHDHDDDDDRLEVFDLSFLCVWNQMSWRNLQTVVVLQDWFGLLGFMAYQPL